MRIVGGNLRGGKLHTFRGDGIRPTADRVRESIFNIIRAQVSAASVLDLFAGTGALGIEALSRGAARAVFVDSSPEAVSLVGRNVKKFSLEGRSKIFRRDIAKSLNHVTPPESLFNLVFMDPPYNTGLIGRTLVMLQKCDVLEKGAIVVMEHSPSEATTADERFFTVTDSRRYGKTLVSFATYMI